jgi:hypothetical protein
VLVEAPAAQRKRSPRPSIIGRKIPALAEAQRRLWADPDHRARMKEARQRSVAVRRTDPTKYTRLGVPDGMRRAEAQKLWDAARAQAGEYVAALETKGIVPISPVPESDEEKAKAAIHEVAVLALGPSNQRDKIRALRLLLAYTKELPTILRKTSITTEDLLKAATRHSAPTNHDNIQPNEAT